MNANIATVQEKNSYPAAYSPQIASLDTWEAAVSMGVMFVEERDKWSWALGELASFVRTSKPIGGRPRKSEMLGTLSAFADDIGMRRESISAMCQNFEFYQSIRDQLPENVTWHQLSEARRRSGWRPGMEIEDEHRQHALEFAEEYADATPPKVKRTLADKLADECDRLESIFNREDARLVRAGIRRAIDALNQMIDELRR